jgi:hypothetical protein
MLYSVGWNETDDGGVVVTKSNPPRLVVDQGDWVWRYPLGTGANHGLSHQNE